MKTVLRFLLSVTVLTVRAEAGKVAEDKYYRYVHHKDDYGVLRLVDLEAQPDTELIQKIQRNPDSNEYLLFTRRNPTSPQRLTLNASSILSSNFNPNASTVVSVHGWQGSSSALNNIVIRNAFLNRVDCNVIAMGWSELAAADYSTAVGGIPAVGRGLGQFLNFLGSSTGMSLASVHLIGFSLGAHVVANAGKQLNGRIARITGLDPAGPLWNLNANRLDASDALYVEAIHTDAGPNGVGIGFMVTVGDVDVYPNGGVSQPGCATSQCNHNRAWEMFAASVSYNHLMGRRCLDTAQLVADRCTGNILSMGNADLNKQAYPGIYRVNTAAQYPF